MAAEDGFIGQDTGRLKQVRIDFKTAVRSVADLRHGDSVNMGS
jgi:hypothetical protein